MKKIILVLSILVTSALMSFAQVSKCGTDEFNARLMQQNPQFMAAKADYDAKWKEFVKNYNPDDYSTKPGMKKATVKYIIPVVVHVFHANGSENVSDATIQASIDRMNQYYKGNGPNVASVRSMFKGLIADCQIEFRLAKKDPNGNCTNGIDRIYTPLTYKATSDIKQLSVWDTKRYMNVWLASSVNDGFSAVGGFSTLPTGGFSNTEDGTICVTNQFISDNTGAHEAGHWLGLYHPFQNQGGDSCVDHDGVADTPPTYFQTSTGPVNSGRGDHCADTAYNTCSTDKPDLPDQQENIMDYFDGACAHSMFTLGQKARMWFTLDNYRVQLWSAENLARTGVDGSVTTPCAPIAAFNTKTPRTCAGNSIQFFDFSYNGSVTGWNWIFPGGTPGTATGKAPSAITYNTAGTYDVTLIASGPNGTDTTTLKNYITIEPAATSLPKGYYTADWWYQNNWKEQGYYFQYEYANPKNSFQRVSSSYAQNASMMLPQDPFDVYNSVNAIYSFITPSYNLEGLNAYFAFDYSFAQAQLSTALGGPSSEELKVYASTDCGKTWVLKAQRGQSNIATISPSTLNSSINFIPVDKTKWKEIMLSGSTQVPNNANVKFKIDFKYYGGNNFYLDNVRVGTATGLHESKLAEELNFKIYPNPFEGNTSITYALPQSSQVEIKLFDIVGKEIATIYQGQQDAGTQEYSISKSSLNLNSGLYFVGVTVGSAYFSKKVVVE